jgi:hypothetical protein
MRNRLIATFLGAVFVAAILSYRFVTSPPGYCLAQGRHIKDDEFVKASIALTYRDMERIIEPYPERKRIRNKDWTRIYKDWDFDPKNANCCYVYRDETYPIINRLLGLQKIQVWLNPKTSTHPVDAGDGQIRFRWDVCGTLIEGIGIPNRANSTITTRNINDL